MDADRLIRLHTAQEERGKLEKRIARAPVADREEMERLLNSLNSQVARLQREVLGTYHSNYIVCRDTGHAWDETAKFVDDSGLNRTLTCSRCEMDRVEIVTRFGALVYRNYVRPEDYTLPKGVSVGRSKTFWRGLAYMQATR